MGDKVDALFDDVFGPQSTKPDPVDAMFDDVFGAPKRSEADILQDTAELAHEDRVKKFDAAFPGIDADTERLMSTIDPLFEDGPTPKSYPEALRRVMQYNSIEHVPNPKISAEIEQWADKLTFMQLNQSNLLDESGARAGIDADLIDEMRGGYLYNLTVLYSDMAPEEYQRVNQRAIKRLAGLMRGNAQSRLQALEQQRETVSAGQAPLGPAGVGTSRDLDKVLEGIQTAQEDFAQAQELDSLSGDGKTQAWFLGTMYDAISQVKRFSPADTPEADRSAILQGILDAPFTEAKIGDWPEAARGKGPFAERMHGLMERNLKLQNERGKARAFAMENALEMAYRGSLIEERLGMLGISKENAATITPGQMLSHTHPGIVQKLGSAKALNEGKAFIANKKGVPLQDVSNLTEKIEEWAAANGARIADELLNVGSAPLAELQAQIDFSGREGLDAVKDTIDSTLDGLAQYAMLGTDTAGDAIGKAQQFYGLALGTSTGIEEKEFDMEMAGQLRLMLTEGLTPDQARERSRELMEASTMLGIGAMASSAAARIGAGMEEGEADAQLVNPTGLTTKHNNKWLSDLGQLTKQVRGENGTRMGLTRETSERIFDSGGNAMRQLAMVMSDEIAAVTAETYVPLGFHPETIRAAFKQLRTKEFSDRLDTSILRGVTEEEFEAEAFRVAGRRRARAEFAALSETAKKGAARRGSLEAATGEFSLLRDRPMSAEVLSSSLLDTWGLATMAFGRDVRSVTQMLLEEPDDLAVITAAGVGAGWMGNMALRGLKTQTLDRLSNAMTMTRARIVVKNALRNNPDAVFNMRKTLSRMQQKGQGTGARGAAMEAATDALEYISDTRHLVKETTPDFQDLGLLKWLDGQTKNASKTASGIIRHIDPNDLDTLLDDFKLDGVTRHWIRHTGLFRTLREAVRDNFQFRLGDKTIRMRSGASPELLFDSIERNPATDLTGLPFNPESLTAENLPFWQKVLPSRAPDIAQARATREALEWVADYKKDTLEVRAFGAEARSHLEEWTGMMRTVEANRRRKIAVWRAAAQGAGDQRREQQLQELRKGSLGRVSRARSTRQELLTRNFDDQVRGLASADHPLFADYTPEQVMAFLQVRNGRHAVYERLRGLFESEESFYDRIGKMSRRFDEPDEALDAASAKFKGQMIREFFESPGLRDKQRFDVLDGHISDRRLARNLRERRRIGDAFLRKEVADLRDSLPDADQPLLDELILKYDQELTQLEAWVVDPTGPLPEAMLGHFRGRQNLKSVWDEVKRRASTERANRLVVVGGISGAAEWGNGFEVSSRIFDGRMRTHLQDAKDQGLQQRMLTRAYTAKINNAQAIFDTFTPDEQKLFNAAAAIARDEGIEAPLASLRKRFPKYFDAIAPQTDDAAAQNLWNNVDGFRKRFLKDMSDAGLIDKATYEKLIGPYAPRLYTSSELPRLYGVDGADLWATPSKTLGVSLGELEASRHITQFKAQIYARGGRPITRKFDTKDEAVAWVKRNYGVKGDTVKEGPGSISGDTTAGTRYAILDPLGGEAAELGAIPAGQGMFIQMRRLVDDMLQIRYFNQFDRKGVALTSAEFAMIELEKGNQYTLLPETKRFGALSGKYVHKNVLAQIEDYSSAKSIQSAIADAVDEEVVGMAADAGTLLRATKGIIGSLNTDLKQGIMYNGIARNPATQIGNFLSDAMYFAKAAAGGGLNTTVDGFKHAVEAWKAIRGLRTGKVNIDDLSPEMRRGIELGVIDDQIFGEGAPGARRLRDIQAIFGKNTPLEAFLSPIRDPRLKATMRREAQIDRILARPNLTPEKRARMTREKMAIRKITESNQGILAKGWARAVNLKRAFIGTRKGRFGDIESASATFYGDIGNLNRARAYLYLVRNKGFTPEEAASRINRFMQTYSRVGLNPIGKAVQKLGRTFLGSPIVSFPFELVRINLNLVRQNPGFLAGFMMSGVARNMMAIGAAGADPYAAMESLSGNSNLPPIASLMGKQYVPLPNQQMLITSNPALMIYEQFFNNMGFTNSSVNAWEDYGDDTPLSTFMRTGIRAGTNFAFSSPMVNFMASTVAKGDSFTGERRRDGVELIGDNFARMLQPLMHPYAPILGTHAQKLQKVKESFPHAYTQREHSMLNKMIELSGFRVKGDVSAFLAALPAGMRDPAEDIALRVTKAGAWFFLWDDVPEERLLGEGRGLDAKDYLALTIASSAYLDPQNGGDMQGAREKSLRQMRSALSMLDSEDPAEQRAGADLMQESEAALRDLFTTRQRAGFLAGRDATDKEIRNVVARMLQLGDGYNNALDTMSVLRRAAVVSKMAMTKDVPDDMVDNLFRQYILTQNGGLRGPTGKEELEQAANYIDAALKTGRMSDKNAERLQTMAKITRAWIPMAEVRQMIEDQTVDKYRNAAEVQRRAEEARQ
ncbi:MAG: hypothetical protein V3S83_12565 [Gemmatimonadota bacterium]